MKRVVASSALVSSALLGAQEPGMIEWRYVGADQAHTKYSIADEITAANVDQLEIAWQWEPNEMPMPEIGARPSSFQATPIMLDNVLYVSTAYNRVAAIDAETGAELWVFDPKAYERETRHGFIHRGIAYWRDGETRMSNMYLSILRSLGIEEEGFSDSTSTLGGSIFTRS